MPLWTIYHGEETIQRSAPWLRGRRRQAAEQAVDRYLVEGSQEDLVNDLQKALRRDPGRLVREIAW